MSTQRAALALLLLTSQVALAGPKAPAPKLSDERPPDGTFNGPASARFARSVTLHIAPDVGEEVTIKKQGMPQRDYGTTRAPTDALRRYALAAARRHFEDASWADDAGARSSKRQARQKAHGGREVIIKHISIEAARGPSYTVIIEVERRVGGRRKGAATGRGFAVPDRSGAQRSASILPGPFGLVARHKASAPSAKKDAAIIEIASLRALDQALLQLAAVWAGEQAVEDARKKARRRR